MQNLPGFRDFYPDDCARRNYILSTWREVARRYGFVEYDGPVLEPIELYEKKSGGELVGQLFDCGVEELDRKQPEQRGDHRHVPGDGRCNEDGRNEAGNEGDHLLAERSLAAKAIADSP